MFKFLSDEHKQAFFNLLPLLIAIYCAAIIGDYASEALVIKYLSVNTLPNLFQLNAFLLFLLSAGLFRFVDRVERLTLVRVLSILFFLVVTVCGLLVFKGHAGAAVVLYGAAYLGKISLFLMFWIMANDVCDTRKSKAIFPMLAGGGLCGGLLATLVSGKIIHLIRVENLLWLWAFLLLIPLFLTRRISERYVLELKAADADTPRKISEEFQTVFRERAVITMAAVYFLVFVLLFNVDFIFAKTLSRHFTLTGASFNAESFVAFKFNAYLVTTTLIILFQFIMTSNISRRFGVTGSLLVLPIAFAICFMVLHLLGFRMRSEEISSLLFYSVILFYVLRQFLFEALFSSNYQIFFSAFSRKFRGKGKLLLEGLVKPLGIAFAGIFILAFQNTAAYCLLLSLCAGLLTLLIAFLKQEYSRILLSEETDSGKADIMKLIKREISGKNRDKILSLISRAMNSQDYDLKRVSIRYLEYSASHSAFEILRKKFFEETDRIKEVISNSLSTFDSLEARGFLRSLLEDPNASIRAGALRSIRKNPMLRPKRFDFHSLIYDHHPLVFEEAALFIYPELSREFRNTVHDKVSEYLNSDRMDETVTAMHMIGFLKLNAFFDRLAPYLHSHSRDVWRTAVDAILAFNSEKGVRTLVEFIEADVDRAKENYVINGLGRAETALGSILEELFLSARKKRTAFSLIRVLRLMAMRHLQEKGRTLRQRTEIRDRLIDMAMQEMQIIYEDVYRYWDLRLHIPVEHKAIDILQDAIANKRRRFSLFILDMLSLLDESGALLSIDRNFKHLDDREKANVIELIEAFGDKSISRFLVPILEDYTPRELLKIGSGKWAYRQQTLETALRYFKDLDNRWIFFVSLYIERKARKYAA